MQGKLIGERYRILDRLGEGGMAVVFIARDEKLGRKVAIKVLHQHFAENQDVRQRFAMEATAISTMDHPNILNVYDFSGPNSKQLWIVTELLHGQTLSQFAKSFRNSCINPIVGCFIVREILKALEHAHGKDVVHRDIKPDNVMVQKNGRVILMDFGIAKNMDKGSMTQTGTFMGSPSYMSPEQIRGKDVDARSDIYSLGVLFYEIIAGRLPYTGDSTHAVILKITEGKYTAPRFLIPKLPEEIDRIICHAMHRTPKSRFQNSRSFSEQIDLFIQKIGFVESHVELERYAASPSKYMAQLQKMTQNSIALGTIKTAHAQKIRPLKVPNEQTVAQKNQESILKPVEFHREQTRLEKIQPVKSRADRVLPQGLPKKTRPTIKLANKAHIPRLPTHDKKSVNISRSKRRRARPIVAKKTRPLAKRRRELRRELRRSAQPKSDNPLIGMLVLMAIFVGLAWGFNELVIKPHENKISIRQPDLGRNNTEKTRLRTDEIRRQQPAPVRKTTPVPKHRVQIKPPSSKQPSLKKRKRLEPTPKPVMPKAVATAPKLQPKAARPISRVIERPPEKATLVVSANTAAHIFIDDRPHGTTTDDTYHSRPIEVAPGRRKITLKHRAYDDLTIYKNVKPGQRLKLNELQLVKKVKKIKLKVNVNAFPTRMSIRGNNVFIRRDILRANEKILLDPGAYELRVQHEGKIIERRVDLKENSSDITINLDFTRR